MGVNLSSLLLNQTFKFIHVGLTPNLCSSHFEKDLFYPENVSYCYSIGLKLTNCLTNGEFLFFFTKDLHCTHYRCKVFFFFCCTESPELCYIYRNTPLAFVPHTSPQQATGSELFFITSYTQKPNTSR